MITNNNNPQPQPDNQSNQKSNRRPIIIGAVSAGLLLIVAGWLVYSSQKALHQLQNEKDQMQLDYEQQQLAQDAGAPLLTVRCSTGIPPRCATNSLIGAPLVIKEGAPLIRA